MEWLRLGLLCWVGVREGKGGKTGREGRMRGFKVIHTAYRGILTDVGRTAYIDSELAKRRQERTAARSQPPSAISATTTRAEGTQLERDRGKDVEVQRQPAALGKLFEIDLGDEARDRNVERTEQARRRMDGEVVEEEQAPKGKVRLGRDGKPWRPRKRRGSNDVKRDMLVEDVLRENRCEYGPSLHLPLLMLICMQWRYTTRYRLNQWRSTMTRPRTISSRRHSGKSSWTQSRRGKGRRRRPCSLHLEDLEGRGRRSSRARSWAEAEVHELLCARRY